MQAHDGLSYTGKGMPCNIDFLTIATHEIIYIGDLYRLRLVHLFSLSSPVNISLV